MSLAKITKPLMLLGLATTLSISPALGAPKSKSQISLEKCASGNAKKNIKIYGHKFNCHKPKRVELASWERKDKGSNPYYTALAQAKFKGKLSHALRFRKDDQVHYTLKIYMYLVQNRADKNKISRNPKQYYRCDIHVGTTLKRGGFGKAIGLAGRAFKKTDWEKRWNDSSWESRGRKGKTRWEDVAELVLMRVAYNHANSRYVSYRSKGRTRSCDFVKFLVKPNIR